MSQLDEVLNFFDLLVQITIADFVLSVIDSTKLEERTLLERVDHIESEIICIWGESD